MRRTLTDALRASMRSGELGLHVSMPARVESYDADQQKASVQPLIRDEQGNDRQIISGVPVVWPRGGGAAMTMDLQQGDGVLLVFADRSIDSWVFSTGGTVDARDRRAHGYSDAIAVPGLVPYAEAGHETGAIFGYPEGARARFLDDKMALGNDSEELLSLFAECLDALVNAICIDGSHLSTQAAFQDVRARLDEIKGEL